MSFVSGTTDTEAAQKFLEVLQNDFRNLSLETKKKYPQIKESCEEAILKLKAAGANPQTPVYYVVNQILYPLVQGCESKDLKIIKFCLGMMQRLITQQVVDQKGARYITDTLWMLMENGTEEVKVLQSVTLLLTTNTVVHGETLAKTLVLCFRLHFTKDSTTINTAGATVRQLVSLVFERVVAETEAERNAAPNAADTERREVNLEELKLATGVAPKGLPPCAADAFLLFQDLVQLVNADQPYWLLGMTEMTRTFGLELLESVLTQYTSVFYRNPEFSFLLKERVCALVIKLFSPNIKYRSVATPQVGAAIGGAGAAQAGAPHDKPYFPISMRLLRVVSILIQKYHALLVTECEIFLSLIVKFLDPDKPAWQRSLALEVLHKMTIQPELLISFCRCYDLKDHATNIFQDIINSLGTYVQSLFVNPQLLSSSLSTGGGAAGGGNGGAGVGGGIGGTGQQSQLMGGLPVGPGISPQPGFIFRGVFLPLVVTFPSGQSKATFLEMLDKMEPPPIPDGYGISVAYACLLDIVRSISLSIQGPSQLGEEHPLPYPQRVSEADKALHIQLIHSSWMGLLTALGPLIDAATDESSTESVLKAIQSYAALCGLLELHTPRDAFITALCRASLPPHYALSVLNVSYQGANQTKAPYRHGGHEFGAPGLFHGGGYGEFDQQQQHHQQQQQQQQQQQRHPVVAVGTPLPTSSLPIGAHQGPVLLTAKNLQCMRSVLHLAHCHGSILGSSWHIVLTTLQHLAWILGLKPSTGGSLQAVQKPPTDANSITQVMTDLPVLSTMLSQLFEASQYLDDVALHHLIDALCKLSHEAMELAYNNREPSLFAVAKLLETGLVNLSRIEVLWRPLTNHLLEICQHPHIRMREWGVEAITYLVKAALQYKYERPLKENLKLQTLLLGPLAELSSVPHGDVRQRQLDCVLLVLNGAGETLSHGWPLVLGIIGAVNDHHGEALIRIAFQCLQLVVTDFLPVMPWRCLPLCVNTAAKFGSQTQELNISLTAVGLMWNISDYFNQNQEKLSQTVCDDMSVLPDFPGTLNMPHFDRLWMCLYARLGDLCVDPRPAVRKSAGQTLFSTISAHGALLNPPTWQAVLWQVLFPLLDKVRALSSCASSEKVDTSGNILIHHSRNTAQKQWAETQVLTLSGVSRVFNTKRALLQMLGDFPRAWALLLEFIENSALSKSNEVSLAALKSFQEILYNRPPSGTASAVAAPGTGDASSATKAVDGSAGTDADIWNVAWRVWLNIGAESTKPPTITATEQSSDKVGSGSGAGGGGGAGDELYIPSQAFLTALVHIFPALFQHIRTRFNSKDLTQLCAVLMNAVAVPVHSDSTPYIMSTISDSLLTPLHDGVLDCMELLQKEAIGGGSKSETAGLKSMISAIFKQLLSFSKFACAPPSFDRIETRPLKTARSGSGTGTNTGSSATGGGLIHPVASGNANGVEWVSMNYIPFGEKALAVAVKLYQQTAHEPTVIEGQILHEIIKALHLPLSLKYKCMSSSTWKLAISSLISVLHTGLPVARQYPKQFAPMWKDLADTLDQFLFTKSVCIVEDRGLDELILDETIDCQVIELIRDEILPHSQEIPQQFILDAVVILNKGSIHSATTGSTPFAGCETELKLREEFAKTCFETLLQFSLLDDRVRSGAPGSGNDKDSNMANNNINNSAQGSSNGATIEGGIAGQLAITALLHRFEEVLRKFNEDERLSGKFPLPRYRLSEISFVLKAVATLVISMKKAPPAKVGTTAWEQLINLYPYLVDCTTTSSAEVSRSLREALLQYCDLLRPPCSTEEGSAGQSTTNSSGPGRANNNNEIANTNGISHC
ncbi:protein MON2 homolog [Anopheles aquasalis]|uniref:protein MON2 homolog n=1 Tax=Anopheles aquasalis TaxID=42839 RepID=UPI00215B3C22|nr:protein MON2 homolog [Anopheles aquasalis]